MIKVDGWWLRNFSWNLWTNASFQELPWNSPRNEKAKVFLQFAFIFAITHDKLSHWNTYLQSHPWWYLFLGLMVGFLCQDNHVDLKKQIWQHNLVRKFYCLGRCCSHASYSCTYFYICPASRQSQLFLCLFL